ncbi:MAG: amidohydrolase [Dehalococcoidia bacterium]|nr:MAG: amidohydrolase [Dehalococcoidia bacterium]
MDLLTSTAAALKQAALAALNDRRHDLIALSRAIHSDPEIAFQETRAAARLADLLAAAGFAVERGVGGLATAFRAEFGSSGPAIGICAEYDALPELGHGCGHNIIAAAAAGAGLALAALGHRLPGRVVVIGTPAEEGGGGKVILLERGVFHGLDAAMMIHPATRNLVDRGSLASLRVEVTFHGRAVHADAPPGSGISALDAMIQLFAGANALRATMLPTARLHGIIVEGGVTPTMVPGRAVARFSVRATERQYAEALRDRFRRIAEGAALATETELEFTVAPGYENMVPNQAIARAFAANLNALGRTVTPTTGHERMGSTDMGNVSQAIPAIHAYLSIAREGISGHSVAFREAACSPEGDQAALDGAAALAMTTIDLLTNRELFRQMQDEFAAQRAAGRVKGLPEA